MLPLLGWGSSGHVSAESVSEEAHEARATRVTSADRPRVDGFLDDPVWQKASVVGRFRQREPDEGAPATEPTEVRIIYDVDALYFGIRCHDSLPHLIRATELRRDDTLENDDTVSILLDTFLDRRNASLFRVNPLGTQYDALITEEGRDLNEDWDEVWSSEARIDESGWTIEVRIPFTSLRSPPQPVQVWGLNIERVIRRRNEFAYWSGYGRSWSFWNVSQAGTLTGLEGVRTGLRLRVKPYVVAGFSAAPDKRGTDFSNESGVGLEDVKISFSPSITGDLTVNPDFAQTDVDAARVNLTRFTLFFPEKRQFFLEGSDIFRFGTPPARFEDIVPELLVFHSRRVGLSADGTPIPILVGGKISGRHRGLQFGGLNAQTLHDGPTPAANLGVLRVKQSIFPRSYVGAVFTNKVEWDGGQTNRVGGLDANIVLFEKLTVSALAAKSASSGIQERQGAWMAIARWTDSRFDIDLEHAEFGEHFKPELGFLRRGGVTRDRVMFGWKARPPVSWIRQLYLASGHQWFESYRGFLESRDNDTLGILFLESGDAFGVELLHDYEFFEATYPIHPEVTLPAGSYTFTGADVFATAYSGRRLSGSVHVRAGGFYDGSIRSIGIAPLLKLTENLAMALEYERNNVDLSTGRFNASSLNSQVHFNFTNKWLTSAGARYDNISRGFLVNLRLNYIYRPGDDLFVVYNEQRDFSSGNDLVERALLVKLNHSFDF